jgi:hypothetical protein
VTALAQNHNAAIHVSLLFLTIGVVLLRPGYLAFGTHQVQSPSDNETVRCTHRFFNLHHLGTALLIVVTTRAVVLTALGAAVFWLVSRLYISKQPTVKAHKKMIMHVIRILPLSLVYVLFLVTQIHDVMEMQEKACCRLSTNHPCIQTCHRLV